MTRDVSAKKTGESTLIVTPAKENGKGRSLTSSESSALTEASPRPKKRKRESKVEPPDEKAGNYEEKNTSVKLSRLGKKADDFEDQTAAKGNISTSDRKAQKSRTDGSKKSQNFSGISHSSLETDGSPSDLRLGASDSKKFKNRKNKVTGENELNTDKAEDETPVKVRKRKHDRSLELPDDDDEKQPAKHAKIMKKFERSTKIRKTVIEDVEEKKEKFLAGETGSAIVAHGLEPLPQPEPAVETDEKPTYSTMPNWITNPITKSPYLRDDEEPLKFDKLNLDRDMVAKLKKRGYTEVTQVQATVIPLLIDNLYRHKGDLCVSASTGSGKTLSYVLPIDQALQRESFPRLRGLIVVPTRELVKQVREAFEVCGSNLRIGTAIGHVALKDEQQKIIRWESVYNPKIYDEEQQKTMSEHDWASFDLLKYRDEVERSHDLLPQYIQVPQSNIDVLISTPGRLVDHIRQTDGFTLQHLQWLVIDEADRLLNESFQEWVSVLMTALDKEKTANIGDSVMANIGRPLQSRYPRKVILSATLTNDITKLNSLRLDNPKLVAIGSRGPGPDDEGTNHETEQFVLPESLVEHFVPVGDESEKPIHLMKLLLHEINISPRSTIMTPAYATILGYKYIGSSRMDNTTSSDSDSTSSSGDDTSSADATSESDSASDSDSTSSSGSDSASDMSEADTDSGSESESSADEDVSSAKELLITKNDITSVLVFTKSTESAARLSHLLGLMNPALKDKIGTIVKSSNSSSSRKTLKDYRAGKINIIVATDRASRGIDLIGLGAVINYDLPTSLTTYVHRVGRTARAGKSGHAWTLVEHREGLWFQKVIVKSENVVRSGKVTKYSRLGENTKAMIGEYTAALQGLEKAVKG